MELILASNNTKKILEIRKLLPGLQISSMKEAGFDAEIPEPYLTYTDNAFQKAKTIADWSGKSALADDSGLVVPALNGAPGVHSARYAGPNATDQENLEKLLHEMNEVNDRSAYYVAVLCLIKNGQAHYFEGRCYGSIAINAKGTNGFGYDPVFIPEGYDQTFGELDESVKKKISHRSKALQALKESGLLASFQEL